MTGASLRAAIAAACDLTNPRLSEVDWDEVASAFVRLRDDPAPGLPHSIEVAASQPVAEEGE